MVALVDHLPRAESAAMATFDEITHNDYHDRKLGRPPGKFDDYMVCDCNPNLISESIACSDDAGCINRLTQIECDAASCRFGKQCHNQRFHRRQYAAIEIVQTERKGFGLRAGQTLYKEDFIYEYVGEVMNHTTFLDRMEQYRVENIRHFYFMMLQPNEYLDATKRGGKARFINHSCNPNCSVSKWQVGKHYRMGIFAKRNIQMGEELTFNYNVDRYGNDAQECYCGESNCVGMLGGKTQTDLSGMDDLFLEALGIRDEVEETEAKGSRRKKGKKLDLDYMPSMQPMDPSEATKVMTAVRQAGPKRAILIRLLQRMEMTTNVEVQKTLVKLHGFLLMQFLLEQWASDREMVLLIIGALSRWPLLARNKVVDSGVMDQVRALCTYSEDESADSSTPSVSQRASQLLDAWEKLQLSYRIAKREGGVEWEDRRRMEEEVVAEVEEFEAEPVWMPPPMPLPARRPETNASTPSKRSEEPRATRTPPSPEHSKPTKSIEDIIREANEEAERALRKREAEAEESTLSPKKAKTTSFERPKLDDKPKQSPAEKTLRKLMGELVVRQMSKHKDHLPKDAFKKYAKQLTDLIVAKEMRNPRSWPPPSGQLTELSDEKRSKVKAFATEYIAKLIARKGKPNGFHDGVNGDLATSQSNTPASAS